MPAFKRRTRAERRNRAKHKLARQIKNETSFGARRNSLRFIRRLLARSRRCLGAEFCDRITNLIDLYRSTL